MTQANRKSSNRRGSVYLAVLGTALVASVLALSALGLQRIHNRQLTASTYIRQAQLNAEAATGLGLLTIQQNSNWRNNRDAQDYLYVDRSLGDGATCSLQATDAPSEAADAADRPIMLLGVGQQTAPPGRVSHLTADQRVELTIDPQRDPHDCLKPGTTALPDNWQAIVNYYSNPANATQIQLNSLPDRTSTFSRNPSLNDGQTYWTGDLPEGITGYREADDVDVGAYKGHSACMLVERNDWREGAANRLNVALLKPDTSYNVSIEINPDYTGLFASLQSTNFRISLIAEFSDGTTALSPNSIVVLLSGSIIGGNWTNPPITGTLRTPNWTQQPSTVYLVVNSNNSAGTHKNFYIDNLDVYESGARFIYQKVLGPGVNTLYTNAPTNTSEGKSHGIYWINCQGTTKLVIERSRIFGTLLVLNPGPGSCIDYGPIHMSPASPGYPTLLVSNTNGNAFAIRPTPSSVPATDGLRESENGVTYNPAGAPHKTHGTDNDLSDAYDSEIRGLVIVSDNLTTANNPAIRGKVIVGGSGLPTYTYQPDSLLNPPPPLGAFYNYRHDPRTTSVRKVVLP
jgi:hypothetical protein